MEDQRRQKKVLVIDDEPDIIDVIQTVLSSNGFAVVSALNGEEGMEKARTEKPDLIILDILMPKMDGYTFVKRMKGDLVIRSIPVIVLTGKAEMKDLFEVEGVKEYLLKPFEPDQLLELVKRYLL